MKNYGVIPRPEELEQFNETATKHQVPLVEDILDLLVSNYLINQVARDSTGYYATSDNLEIPYNQEGFDHYSKYDLAYRLQAFNEEAIKLAISNLVDKLRLLGYYVDNLYDEDGETTLVVTWMEEDK